jgi:hypothetical protein
MQRTGPALAPSASAQVTFVGRWLDDGGTEQQESEPSLPVTKEVVDPRPLPPPVLPVTLLYARRPDARGDARFELPLPASSPACRIYFTTEGTALRGLELRKSEPGAPVADLDQAIAEIEAAAPGSPRAQALGKWKQLLTGSMFENLTTAPFQPPPEGEIFPHVLSASLEGLALYKVQSVSKTGVLSAFDKAPLVAAMVPNFGPPQRPLVTVVRNKLPGASAETVRLEVNVPTGNFAPANYRVRRATGPQSDVRQMMVVTSGGLDTTGGWLGELPVSDARGTTFVLTDPGPFIDWRKYAWAVEVQAGQPPGAPSTGFIPAGEWSVPSALATLDTVPTDPPAPPDSITAVRTGNDVVVTITATGRAAVVPTPIGIFQLDVFRTVPGTGQRPQRVSATQTGATVFTATDTGAPAGAIYIVRIIDPLGRPSEALSTPTPV